MYFINMSVEHNQEHTTIHSPHTFTMCIRVLHFESNNELFLQLHSQNTTAYEIQHTGCNGHRHQILVTNIVHNIHYNCLITLLIKLP